MNQRIRELAEQAGFYVADGKIYIPSTSEEITTCQKKFAELIVRECAELATKEYNNRGAIHGNDLLQHFGVDA
jgi:hypothetical protein